MPQRTSFKYLATAAFVVFGLALGAVPAGAFTSWSVAASPNPAIWGNILKGVAATSASDVWAVGNAATQTNNRTLIERWNGSTWTAVPSPSPSSSCQDGNIQWTGNNLKAVAAVGPGDVWAVGHSCYLRNTLVEHWNGVSWSIVPSPSFNTGGDGIQNWLSGVDAVSSANVWAVGAHTASNGAYLTLVERWDGTSWRVVSSSNPSPTSNILNAVQAVSAGDIWAVGYFRTGTGSQPLIEHWNGTAWSVVPSPTLRTGSVLSAITAVSATDVWAFGFQPGASGAVLTLVEHWNGTSWSVVPSPNLSTEYGSANVLLGASAVSPTQVWAVGMYQNESTDYHQHRTLTMRWTGTAWRVVASPTRGESGELNAITALPSGRLWAVGLYSPYEINIYDGTYTAPRTLVLTG
jgi:hypothetical protein